MNTTVDKYECGRLAGRDEVIRFIKANAEGIIQDNRNIVDSLLDIADLLKAIDTLDTGRVDTTLYFDEGLTEDKLKELLNRLYVPKCPETTHYNVEVMLSVLDGHTNT